MALWNRRKDRAVARTASTGDSASVRTAAPGDSLATLDAALNRGLGMVNVYGRSMREVAWQAEIRKYDDQGPLVTQALNANATLVSLAHHGVQRKRAGRWVTLSEKQADERDRFMMTLLGTLFGAYANVEQLEPEELIFDHARAFYGVGELSIMNVEQYGWVVAQAPERLLGPEGTLLWRDADGIPHRVITETIHRSYNRALGRRGEVSTPFKQALPNIHRYVVAVNAQMRPVVSSIVANKVARLPHSRIPGENRRIVDDILQIAAEEIVDLTYLSPIRDPRQAVPYFIEGDQEIQVEDLGSKLDPELFRMEQAAIEAFAGVIDMPIKLFRDGVGEGKFRNDDSQMVAYLTQHIDPLCRRVYGAVNRAVIWPQVVKLVEIAQRRRTESEGWSLLASVFPDEYRIMGDPRSLIVSPDRTRELLDANKLGIIGREPVARALNEEVMDARGIDDFEVWQANLTKQVDGVSAVMPTADRQPLPDASSSHRVAAIAAPIPPEPAGIYTRPVEPEVDPEGEIIARMLHRIDFEAAAAIRDWAIDHLPRVTQRTVAAAICTLEKGGEQRTRLASAANVDVYEELRSADWTALAMKATEEVPTDEIARIIRRAGTQIAEIVPGVPPPLLAEARIAALDMLAAAAKWSLAGGDALAMISAGNVLAAADDDDNVVNGRGRVGCIAQGHHVTVALEASGWQVGRNPSWATVAVEFPMTLTRRPS